MKQVVDEAVILRRINYGESDRIITVLAKTSGKVTLIAKGVRKQKSRLSGGIELLSVSELGFLEGKSDIKTLTSSRIVDHYQAIVEDLEKMNQIFEALKKIEKLCDDGHGQEYYPLIVGYLQALTSDYEPKISEVWFNLKLLKIAGVLGEIDVRYEGESPPKQYVFNAKEQYFSAHEQGDFSQNDIKLLRVLSQSAAPLRIESASVSPASLLQATHSLFAMNLT